MTSNNTPNRSEKREERDSSREESTGKRKVEIKWILPTILICSFLALFSYRVVKVFKSFREFPQVLGASPFLPETSIYEKEFHPEHWFDDAKVLELCRAVVKQDVEGMRRAIAAGADVNARGRGGLPLLLWAYPAGKAGMECLLENGADPNIVFLSSYVGNRVIRPGSTILYQAVESCCGSNKKKFDGYVELLLKYGADPNLGDVKPATMATLCYNANRDLLPLLIDAGADVNARDADFGLPALVAFENEADAGLFLLEHGAIYDPTTPQGSALQRLLFREKEIINDPERSKTYAPIRKENIRKAIAWLEERGVDFNEMAPIVKAPKKQWFDDPKLLELCDAIDKEDVEEMQRVIDAGADVNARGESGTVPLTYAFGHGTKVSECLLANGANPNVVYESNCGSDPSFFPVGGSLLFTATRAIERYSFKSRAEEKERYVSVELLLKYDADPNLGSKKPLVEAARIARDAETSDARDAIFALVDAGADVNQCDHFHSDNPAIIECIRGEQYDLVPYLLKRGASCDVNTPQGAALQRWIYEIAFKYPKAFKGKKFDRTRPKDMEEYRHISEAAQWLEERGVKFDAPVPQRLRKPYEEFE